jgi:hypothetical protein
MNRLALPPTDMFIGHHVLIGTSMAMGCLCRNNAPRVPFRTTAPIRQSAAEIVEDSEPSGPRPRLARRVRVAYSGGSARASRCRSARILSSLDGGDPARDRPPDRFGMVFLQEMLARAEPDDLAVVELAGKTLGEGCGDQRTWICREEQLGIARGCERRMRRLHQRVDIGRLAGDGQLVGHAPDRATQVATVCREKGRRSAVYARVSRANFQVCSLANSRPGLQRCSPQSLQRSSSPLLTLVQIEEPWSIAVVSEALELARLTFLVALAHALVLGAARPPTER